MKQIKISYLLSVALCCCFLLIQNTKADNYIKNRTPLAEVPFTPLPIGSVRAEGWLLKQLQLQKEGLTGHAEELYNGADDLGTGSDWLGGTGDSWERVPYYVKGLVALAYVLNDQELKAKAQKWIDWSLDNQRRSGYFGPSGNNDWWARMPMLYAIRDYYEATGDERVIPFFTKYFQYQNANIESQPLSSWGKSRAGDNIEIVFWLYNRTSDAFLLELADKLKSQAYDWTVILTHNTFTQFGTDFQPKHNVNIPQAMKMPAVYYQKSHAEADREAYVRGREHLLSDHGQSHGMQSGNEMLNGKSSLTGLELCSVVEQMQTSETTQMILGDATIGDQLEKVAFNALPGGLSHNIKGLSYYQQANQVISKYGYTGFGQNYDNGLLRSPYSGYGCCRFDFHMGWPYFVKMMWAATVDNGLAAMAYGPCRVTAFVADSIEVTITEATDYPFDETITFTVNISESTKFPLKFRIPAWCKSPEIKVNGATPNGIIEPGTFFTLNQTWKNSDVITLNFHIPLIINEEVNNSVSIQRGPLVFSVQIDEAQTVRNDYGNGFTEFEALPASTWNYALAINRDNPEAFVRVDKTAMTENPFNYANTPVKLTVPARRLPSWTISHNERIATDPPVSPVETAEPVEQVTLVPYGTGTLRVTCLPVVGTPNRITSSFSEDFTNGQNGWVQYGGCFYVKDGEYAATDGTGYSCAKSVATATDFSDFIYDANVQVSGVGDAGLMFRANRLSLGADDYSGYYVGISNSNQQVILGKANGSWNLLETRDMSINLNQWYHIRIAAKGSNIKIFVDDMTTPKINFNDASFSSGSIGVRSWQTPARWDNISVASTVGTNVAEADGKENIRLYPNPVTNDLSISLPQSGRMSVYDSTGKQIFSADVSSGITTLNTDNYNTGIYFLKLITNGGTTCVRFLKKTSLT